jgi:hypothetical protein
VKISIEIGRALAHIHEHGYLYRDLQPRNVRFDDWDAVRLVDFDTAVKLSDREMSDMSQRPVIDYLAPELLEGGTADERADLYSLGATIYEMIAGHPPFAGAREETLVARRIGAPPALDRNDVPWELRDLVLSLLAPEPGQRPANAAKVVEHLEGLSEARADIGRLLVSGESDILEFKSSLRVPVGPPAPDGALEQSVIKTLAAFLNTRGGTLIVGVADDQAIAYITDDRMIVRIADDRAVVGIEGDYKRTQGSSDGWRRTFDELVTNALGNVVMNCMRVQLEPWSGLTIAVIKCSRREEPTWLGDELFIRCTASTVKLTVKEAVAWARERWGPTLSGSSGVPPARHPDRVEAVPQGNLEAAG